MQNPDDVTQTTLFFHLLELSFSRCDMSNIFFKDKKKKKKSSHSNVKVYPSVMKLQISPYEKNNSGVKLTAIFLGDIRATASGVIPSTCSCSRADSTISGKPAGNRDKHSSQIINVSHLKSQQVC